MILFVPHLIVSHIQRKLYIHTFILTCTHRQVFAARWGRRAHNVLVFDTTISNWVARALMQRTAEDEKILPSWSMLGLHWVTNYSKQFDRNEACEIWTEPWRIVICITYLKIGTPRAHTSTAPRLRNLKLSSVKVYPLYHHRKCY